MELPNIFKKPGEEKPEIFWSLIIDKSWIEAGIWKVEDGQVVILARGTSSTWQEGDIESLIAAADSSMSSAATEIPETIEEPEKVVFGLHQTWIDEGDIRSEKLDLLKKISQELELKPAGFVVINEALAHYLKSQEGAPINALLTGLAEDTVDLTLVQNGKIAGSAEVGKSMSLPTDIAEGLAKIPNLPQYPARILLYDHRVADLEEARQNLLSANWEKTGITFLHTPRVDILSEDATLAAISLAGGAEIAQATSVRFENAEVGKSAVVGLVPDPAVAEESPILDVGSEIVAEEESGFTAEEILPVEPVVEETLEQAPVLPEKESQEVSPEELGFTTGAFSSAPIAAPEFHTPETVAEGPSTKKSPLSPLLALFSKVKLPSLNLPGGGGKHRAPAVAGVLGIAAFLILWLAYWFLPKAEVTIFVAPKSIEKTIEFSVSPDVTVADIEKKLIPGRVQEVSVTGEKTTQTTGTKSVGDKAKGKVVIYRASRTSIILPAGTTVSGPNGLKFVLDNEQKIASGSGGARPSETEANVTAAALGAEYNLASGTVFSVGNLSDTDTWAENKAAFSGGSSREVAAVNDKDIANLESSLSTELLQKGIEELKSKLSPSDTLVESSVLLQKNVKTFSNKSGEEASTLKLKLEGKVTALVAPVEGVNQLVRASIEQEVPEGYSLKDDQIDITYKSAPVETPKTTTKKSAAKEEVKTSTQKKYIAEVSANLLPKLNPDTISKSIAGKYPATAKEFLATLPGFTRAEISLNIKLPGKLGTLPRVPKNIIVDVRAEQ